MPCNDGNIPLRFIKKPKNEEKSAMSYLIAEGDRVNNVVDDQDPFNTMALDPLSSTQAQLMIDGSNDVSQMFTKEEIESLHGTPVTPPEQEDSATADQKIEVVENDVIEDEETKECGCEECGCKDLAEAEAAALYSLYRLRQRR